MYKLHLAFRYMKTRITSYLSMFSFLIGVAVLIIVTSVMGGFARDMKKKIRGTTSHIIVTKGLGKLIQQDETLLNDLSQIKNVQSVTPRLEWPVLWTLEAGGTNKMEFGILTGVDRDREVKTSRIEDYVADETLQFTYQGGQNPNHSPVIVGMTSYGPQGSAARYFLPHQKWTIQLTSGKFVGESRLQQKFDVIGLFSSGLSEYDDRRLYTTLESAQNFIGEPGFITHIAFRINDYENEAVIQDVKQQIRSRLHQFNPRAKGKYEIRSWKEQRASLLQAVKVERGLTTILLFLVVIVAAFMLLAVLSMMVMEKRRDIGILRALGGSTMGVASIFLLEGILIGGLGTIFGLGLGYLIVNNLNPIANFIKRWTGWHPFPSDVYFLEKIPSDFDPETAAFIAAATIAVSILFSIIPAWRAARMNPIEAIRHE